MAISAHFINNYRSLFPHIWHLKGFLKISLSFTWMLLARWLCFTFSAIWCFGEQTKTNVVTIWVRCSFPDNWTDTTHLFTKTLWVGQKLQNKKMNHRSRLNRFQNHFVLASKRFCCLGTHSGCASFMVTQYKIHVWFHSQDLNPTNGETVMTTSDEEAGERAVVSGASHSLTRVWTLGRLEAGCFYFHVLQHNNVYKMEFIWSEDTWEEHWSIAPPSPPPPQHQSVQDVKTDPGWVSPCHWQWMGPRCCHYSSPQIPEFLTDLPRGRWTSLRDMAADIL